jgi:hypothetical protein
MIYPPRFRVIEHVSQIHNATLIYYRFVKIATPNRNIFEMNGIENAYNEVLFEHGRGYECVL